MVINYNKLWKQLIDNNMKKTDLIIKCGIGTTTLAKLSKSEPVSMNVIIKICKELKCDISDILELVED